MVVDLLFYLIGPFSILGSKFIRKINRKYNSSLIGDVEMITYIIGVGITAYTLLSGIVFFTEAYFKEGAIDLLDGVYLGFLIIMCISLFILINMVFKETKNEEGSQNNV